MSAQPSRVPVIDVGTPTAEFRSPFSSNHREWEAVELRFHGFENLPAERGNFVDSPEFTRFGHQWKLRLFPGGSTVPRSDDGWFALYLCHLSGESITIQYAISFRPTDRGNSDIYGEFVSGPRRFAPRGTANAAEEDDNAADDIGESWGYKNLLPRTETISSLVEGAVVIQVRMNEPGKAAPSMPFIPENPLSKIILNKFMDEDSADVVFEVGGGEVTTAENKKAKTSPTLFYAHRHILEGALSPPRKPGEDLTKIPIPDVRPEIFRFLLYYAYGGKVSERDLKANAKDIINAADRYEVVNLKLEAEAILVNSTTITVDNVMELVLFADQKNCALLKEAAMDFIVENKADVVKEVSFEDFPGHLTKDVLMADVMDDSVRVSALRKRLHEKGLEIDGSREAMIALLKEHS